MSNILVNLSNIITNPHFYVLIIIVISIITIEYIIRDKSKKNNVSAIQSTPNINSHRILYFLLYVYYGYHFPANFIEFLIFAIIWIFLEKGVCSNTFRKIIGCDHSDNLFCENIVLIGNCKYDHWIDLAINMTGFIIGSMFVSQFKF